jgi:hypothetical protein
MAHALLWRAPMTSRRVFAALTVLATTVVFAACSNPLENCSVGEERCNGGLAEVCVPSGGTGDDSDEDDVHVQGQHPTTAWDVLDHCGAADLCVKPAGDHPFCVTRPQPLALCATSAAVVCEGTTAITCRSGYVVEEMAFQTCPSTAGGQGCALEAQNLPKECGKGYLGDFCKVDSDCAKGLSCIVDGNGVQTCTTRCDPATGAGSPTCAPFHRLAGDPGAGVPSCTVDGTCS